MLIKASKRRGNDYSFDQKSNLDDYLPNRTFDNHHQHHHGEDAIPTNERGTPEKVHYQFVNRFKSVSLFLKKFIFNLNFR